MFVNKFNVFISVKENVNLLLTYTDVTPESLCLSLVHSAILKCLFVIVYPDMKRITSNRFSDITQSRYVCFALSAIRYLLANNVEIITYMKENMHTL